MTRYVIEGRDTEVQPRQTDYIAPRLLLDELRKRRLEEHDIEDEIPADWDSGWNA